MGEALGDACAVLRSNAGSAGMATAVPTCPGWSVRDLVLHMGSVHRWAAAKVAGEQAPNDAQLEAGSRAYDDLLDWFDEGMVEVLNAIYNAPADLDVPFFLPDAPPARDAWLRRQVHETTIHGVDAMAARLGRVPASDEVRVAPWLAADGVDEFLTGFAGHPRLGLGAEHARTVLVEASDADRAWLVTTGAERTRTDRVAPGTDADATLIGTAKQLYLALWGRGDEVEASDPAWWSAWRSAVRITRG